MNTFIVTILLTAKIMTMQSALHDMAVREGVDPNLASCIVAHESRWDPRLVSAAGDTGLFQIIPSTAEWAAAKLDLETYDLTDPETNMQMGLYILKHYPKWYSTLRYCK
ncbi:MAG: transglycosylase SLT domain-containing protein [Anaerolineae bacterium]